MHSARRATFNNLSDLIFLSVALLLALTIPFIIALEISEPAQAAETHVVAGDGKHHWLFPNHPKLRRITKAVGFGAATGGIIGPILGASVGTGMVVGAAEHGTIRGVKDHHDLKKHGRLDHHIW